MRIIQPTRATQLSPLANALILVGFAGALMGESIRRFAMPPEVPGGIVMAVAGLGKLRDHGTAALFHRGQSTALNKGGAYLRLLADAAISFTDNCVVGIEPRSAAWQNGLRPGDIILGVNRKKTRSIKELTGMLRSIDGQIGLYILRGDSTIVIVVR